MAQRSTKQIPILIGKDYRHVMGTAEILEEGNDVKIIISATASGGDAKDLVAIMMTDGLDPLAIQFSAIPVIRRTTSLRKDI